MAIIAEAAKEREIASYLLPVLFLVGLGTTLAFIATIKDTSEWLPRCHSGNPS